MTELHGRQDLSARGAATAAPVPVVPAAAAATAAVATAASATPGIRARRGLRITLLSLAAAILLTGAAAAGVFAYRSLSHGSAASANAATAAVR